MGDSVYVKEKICMLQIKKKKNECASVACEKKNKSSKKGSICRGPRKEWAKFVLTHT